MNWSSVLPRVSWPFLASSSGHAWAASAAPLPPPMTRASVRILSWAASGGIAVRADAAPGSVTPAAVAKNVFAASRLVRFTGKAPALGW